MEYIFRKLEDSDVNVIFDRYFEYSTKSATRTSRAVQQASRRHKLTPSAPLAAQTTALTITENKEQIISTICEQLHEKGKSEAIQEATQQQNIVSLLLDPRQYQLKY